MKEVPEYENHIHTESPCAAAGSVHGAVPGVHGSGRPGAEHSLPAGGGGCPPGAGACGSTPGYVLCTYRLGSGLHRPGGPPWPGADGSVQRPVHCRPGRQSPGAADPSVPGDQSGGPGPADFQSGPRGRAPGRGVEPDPGGQSDLRQRPLWQG